MFPKNEKEKEMDAFLEIFRGRNSHKRFLPVSLLSINARYDPSRGKIVVYARILNARAYYHGCAQRGGVRGQGKGGGGFRNFVAQLAAIFPELAERDPNVGDGAGSETEQRTK